MDYYARGLRVEAGQNLYFLGQLKMEGLQGHYIDGQNGKTIINNIAKFKKVLLSCKEKFHTVTPSNLLLQKTNPDKFRIKFIDFGSWQDLNLIPFASFSQTMYKAKINRRFSKRFYNKLSKSKGAD